MRSDSNTKRAGRNRLDPRLGACVVAVVVGGSIAGERAAEMGRGLPVLHADAVLVRGQAIGTDELADGVKTVEVGPWEQLGGDPEAGREYLLYGDYIGSGVPAQLFDLLTIGQSDEPMVERRGASARLSHAFNRYVTPEGVEVVSGISCLGCHGSVFRGEFVIGMGDSTGDWTGSDPAMYRRLHVMGKLLYPEGSAEQAELAQFVRGADVLQGRSDAPFRGVNPAFRFEEIAAAHRNPSDVSWSADPVFAYDPGETGESLVCSDVPAWWHVKKKHMLYYTGLGRGDFSKLLQQINVVGIGDQEDAARINKGMRDVLAYIMTLEAPVYPGEVDEALALRGRELFNDKCAGCHGTYDSVVGIEGERAQAMGGGGETYPNKIVSVEVVGTDPVYAEELYESGLSAWYNESWYARSEPRSWAAPSLGYVAPPLDGVWATAPYFHNGSVPKLEMVLDSRSRPVYWTRSFSSEDYDLDRPGWVYERVEGAIGEDGRRDKRVYDTTLRGYGNGGHTFGDDLSDEEREALVEYLKTL